MALALIVLALGSILAGYVGVPHALGGENQLHTWLAPAFAAPHVAGDAARAGDGAAAVHGEGGEALDETALERTLMLVSSGIAVLGVGLGWFIWGKRRDIADAMARQFRPLHKLLLNKYYVDEVYDAAVVQPIRVLSEVGLWRNFDVRLIDGAVNGAATVVDAGAEVLRRLQTGSVRTYAGSLVVGVVLIIGYYLWR
jgi:NADH-quinone oxidoreductase subunit L